MTTDRVDVDFGEGYDPDDQYGFGEHDDVVGYADPATSATDIGDRDEADLTGREAPRLHYGSVAEFVGEYWRHTYKRTLDPRNRRWAADWWNYDEAVQRLQALWRAWEHARQDPGTGMSSWWLQHADPQMAALFDKDGPFVDAPEIRTERGEPLPHVEPPEGLFPDERQY